MIGRRRIVVTTSTPAGNEHRLRARWHRVRRTTGCITISLGALTLLFAAHQLWLTDVLQERAQASLRSEFAVATEQHAAMSRAARPTVDDPPGLDSSTKAEILRTTVTESSLRRRTVAPAVPTPAAATSTTDEAAEAPPPVTAAAPSRKAAHEPVPDPQEPPRRGEPIAQLMIPKIGLDQIVVEGTDVEQLERGPGHYVGTALPGQAGNISFAAHRTTYGAPFRRLDELVAGDLVTVRSVDGNDVVYQVTEQFVVPPDRGDVVADHADHRLTLTTCTPEGSASSRLVVVAHPADAVVSDRRSVSTREAVAPTPVPGNRAVSQRTDSGETSPVPGNRSVSQREQHAAVAVDQPAAASSPQSAGGGTVESPVAPWLPAGVWSVALVIVVVAARWLGRRSSWWISATAAAPVALVVLNSLFVNVGRLLPPSF